MILPVIIPLADYISLGPVTRACAAKKRTFQRSEQKLAGQRENIVSESNPEKPTQPALFTNTLVTQGEASLEPEEQLSNAVTFLAKGTASIASTLTYLIYSVCHHPEVRIQLLEDLENLPEDFGDRDLKRVPYLDYAIEETLRMYPAVPGLLLRTVPSGGVEIDGHLIPEGTTVSCPAWSMHRDPSIFPNPHVFYPERWAETSEQMREAMLAWGGRGPRGESHTICFST